MYKYALTAALILAFTGSALAGNFWIVRGPDKKCVVVEKEPMVKETTIIKIGKDVYVTREKAEADIKVHCK